MSTLRIERCFSALIINFPPIVYPGLIAVVFSLPLSCCCFCPPALTQATPLIARTNKGDVIMHDSEQVNPIYRT